MPNSVQKQLRQDLVIRPIPGSNGSIDYVIRDPISRQTFEFDEREYFLCQAFDGQRGLSQIAALFYKQFGLSVSENNLERFARELASYGLLEAPEITRTESFEAGSAVETETSKKSEFKYGITIWSASNPERFLIGLGSLLSPLRFLVWSILPLFTLACAILIQDWGIFLEDITNELQFVSKPFIAFPTLTLNNFTSRGLQTIAATYFGAKTRYLKLFLFLGVIPRLLVDRNLIWMLSRKGKLWSFATPILVRVFLLSIGVLLWHQNRAFSTNLATWAQTLILVNCIGLVIETNPFWVSRVSSGLGWLLTYFSVDPKIFQRSQQLWQLVLQRKQLPTLLTRGKILFLLCYGGMALIASLVLSFGLLIFIAIVLENRLQGTGVVLFCIFLFILLQLITMSRSNNQQHDSSSLTTPEAQTSAPSDFPKPSAGEQASQFIKAHRRSLLFLLGGVLVMLFPYPYSVGGPIQLTPQRSQKIQTDMTGKIIGVPFQGGSREWIEEGTVIAVLESVDLENNQLTTQEQLAAQIAQLEERKAELAQLLSTPRDEEVQVAEAALKQAQEQLEVEKRRQQIAEEELQVALQELAVAQKEAEAVPLRLETVKTEARFRKQEEKRLEELYEGGAIALQRYENVQRLAAIAQDRIREIEQEIEIAQEELVESRNEVQVQRRKVEEQKQKVQASQRVIEQRQTDLNLILEGPHPDAIKAARQQVKQAEAAVKRLEQEVSFLSEELDRQTLRMPFDGFLTTSNLMEKKGRYFKQGDTFATAEDSRTLLGVVEIPEVQIDQLSETGAVEIRLLAYPNRKFAGKVSSIEPTARTDPMFGQTATNEDGETTQYTPERGGQVVSVLIEIDDEDGLLMPGMSGYAKIHGETMPVIFAFSRPLIRFFRLEIWSWLP